LCDKTGQILTPLRNQQAMWQMPAIWRSH